MNLCAGPAQDMGIMFMASPSATSREQPAQRILGAVLVLLILVVFSRSFGSELVFDSKVIVGEDPRVQEVNAATLGDVLTENYWWPSMRSNLYRPVTTLSFMFDHAVLGFRERAAGYQLINLVLHCAVVLWIFALAVRMGAPRLGAFWASAWFAVHPYVTEIVPNVVGRSDLFAVLAILAGFWVYLNILEGKTGVGRGLAWILACGVVGVLAKESAISLLGLIAWHALTLGRDLIAGQRRTGRLSNRALFGGGLVYCIIIATVAVPRLIFEDPSFDRTSLGGDNPLRAISWVDARLNAFSILGRNLVACIVPLDVSADYSFNQIPLGFSTFARITDWWVLAWALGAVGVGVTGLLCFRRQPALSFLIGAVFILLLPVSNLVVLIGTIRGDRLVYPAIFPVVLGVFMLLSGGFFRLQNRLESGFADRIKKMAPVGAALALVVLGAFTHFRGSEWRTTRHFWKSLTLTAPGSYKAKSGWSAVLSRDGDLESSNEAVAASSAALAILEAAGDLPIKKGPTFIEMNALVHIQRGILLREAGRTAEAETDFAYGEEKLEPLVEMTGERNEALFDDIDKGERDHAAGNLKMDGITITLAELKSHRGDKQGARALLERYLKFNRLLPNYLQALGRAVVETGAWEEGLDFLLEASLLDPADARLSGEAAWVWMHHSLPPSAVPLLSDDAKKSLPPLPLINLNDKELAIRTEQAARRIAAVLEDLKLDRQRSVFVRQVRFRVAKPNWLEDLR